MSTSMFNIVCYEEHVTLIAENESDLLKLVYKFSKACQKYNMKISEEKTKSVTFHMNH